MDYRRSEGAHRVTDLSSSESLEYIDTGGLPVCKQAQVTSVVCGVDEPCELGIFWRQDAR